jgi:hypothetical protein
MMGSRIAGRNFAIYAAIASGGTPEPVFFLKTYNGDFSSDQYEVTAAGDTAKSFVLGLPNAKIAYTGYWSNDGRDFYQAAADGLARKFYAYPDRVNSPTTYIYGQAFFTFNLAGDVAGSTTMQGDILGNGAWTRLVSGVVG